MYKISNSNMLLLKKLLGTINWTCAEIFSANQTEPIIDDKASFIMDNIAYIKKILKGAKKDVKKI